MRLEKRLQVVADSLKELADDALNKAKESKVTSMVDYYQGQDSAYRVAAEGILRELERSKK